MCASGILGRHKQVKSAQFKFKEIVVSLKKIRGDLKKNPSITTRRWRLFVFCKATSRTYDVIMALQQKLRWTVQACEKGFVLAKGSEEPSTMMAFLLMHMTFKHTIPYRPPRDMRGAARALDARAEGQTQPFHAHLTRGPRETQPFHAHLTRFIRPQMPPGGGT
jgi:hypothetical protein